MGNFFDKHFFRVYVVPGCVFQSVMIGGGYGTGREIVEYFTRFGLYGGMLSLLVTFATMAIVLALTFELARQFHCHDYRSLMKTLLGPAWVLFEVITILMLPLILAVLAAASGKILGENLGVGYWAGLAAMMTAIALLTYYGREIVANVLTFWSFFLYGVFIAIFAIVLLQSGDDIRAAFARAEVISGWEVSGFKYAMYNLTIAPLVLYTTRPFTSRSEAIGSGLAAAAIALVPGLLFHLAFFADYPQVVEYELPVYRLLDKLGAGILLGFYSVALFGTFIETGAGILQGINERIDNYFLETRGAALSRNVHALTAIAAVVASALLSTWGIVNLIGKGYALGAWFYFGIYVIPLLTIGAWKIYQAK